MKNITFSTDEGFLSLEDNFQTGKIAEDYFEMKYDPGQIPATRENVLWINKHIPDCVNVMKYKGDIIGFTFIIPANKKIMKLFLERKISENEMFETIKKEVTYSNFETIYLCSAFVKPEFRRKGLATKGWIKSIKKITKKRKLIPLLFFWGYSPEGKKIAEVVSKRLNLDIFER